MPVRKLQDFQVLTFDVAGAWMDFEGGMLACLRSAVPDSHVTDDGFLAAHRHAVAPGLGRPDSDERARGLRDSVAQWQAISASNGRMRGSPAVGFQASVPSRQSTSSCGASQLWCWSGNARCPTRRPSATATRTRSRAALAQVARADCDRGPHRPYYELLARSVPELRQEWLDEKDHASA
ncbi:MAG: hypothetical protein ACRYGA_15195 [Janthinobacterium lividum]